MEELILGELTERKIGYGIIQPGESTIGGVPVIKVNNIISGLKSIQDLDTTHPENDQKYRKTRLNGGEIIISVVGTIGKTAIVPMDFKGCNLVRATALIDIKDPILSRWVKYYIDSPKGQSYINGNLNTTVQPTLNIKSLVEMPIPFYGREYAEKVVAILSKIDDKIENNRKINDNLEQQAQALYKSWFVDFEPFKDGEFFESEFGLIPEGWRVGALSDLTEITMGQSPSGKSYNETGDGMLFYQGRAEFGDRYPSIRLYTTEPSRIAEQNSVLLSVRAPVGDTNIAYNKCCIGRGLASIKAKHGFNSFIFYMVKSLKDQFDLYNGEGTVFGSINRDSLNSMKVIVPTNDVISDFEKIVAPLDFKYKSLFTENLLLTQQRDTLLPKLMSGELKINEIDC